MASSKFNSPISGRPSVPAPQVPAGSAEPTAPAAISSKSQALQRVGVDGVSTIGRCATVQRGDDVELARLLAARLEHACEGQVVHADGGFWAWGPTDWRKIEDGDMRAACHGFSCAEMIERKGLLSISAVKIDGIIHETATILRAPGFFDHPTVALNALNTVITVDPAGVVNTRPHDPDDRFRFTIPAAFTVNTDMTPPPGSMLHTLLEGAFRGDPDAADKMWLIAEILGAAAFGLGTRLSAPKAFIFLGESANNGKSTIASLLSCLLPKGSVSAIKPADFCDAARIVNLAGKAANVADEISGAVAGEAFKAAITGNTISGRDLYRSAIAFVPRAVHVFTTNSLPTFNGGLDRGLQRRLVVLTFNRPIPPSEVIVDIADRIRRDELDLLLSFAIAGAIRLIRKQSYTIPASSEVSLRSWLMLDPVHEWFEARTCPCKDEPGTGWLAIRELYRDFKAWAVDQGHAERNLPLVNNFSQRLKAMPGVVMFRRSSGTVAKGITLGCLEGD